MGTSGRRPSNTAARMSGTVRPLKGVSRAHISFSITPNAYTSTCVYMCEQGGQGRGLSRQSLGYFPKSARLDLH